MVSKKTETQESKGKEIAFQNKDIASKIFSENLREKSFSVYGLKLPKIIDILPTNLPLIEANELRIDNLFLLADGTLALVDYESTYADENKIKYLNYIVRTLKRNMKANQLHKSIRMIVIYTADIEPEQTTSRLDIGCLQFQLEEAFLSEIDTYAVEKKISGKIKRKERLTPEEQMLFIILPLTHKQKIQKQNSIRKYFDMIKDIEDEETQTFVLSGMLVFADKIITKDESKMMKRWIMMTKVGQLFEEEKQEAVKESKRQTNLEIARKLLLKGMTIEEIMEVTDTVTREDLETYMKK